MSDTIQEVYGVRPPKPFVMKGAERRGSNPDLMLGIELEIENCSGNADTYIEMLTKYGWVVTTDDSLRGANLGRRGVVAQGNAFEFISKPMTQATALMSLESFFAATKFTEANYTDRTSVHVHANCLDWTFEQISALALLYTVVEEVLFKFIGNNRENNIYCIPWSHCRMNHDMVDRLETEGPVTIKRWQKYTALNLVPLASQGTVEFRHMNGTADVARLHKWINIIGALMGYAKQRELTALIDEVKALNSTSEYEVFFNQVFGGILQYEAGYRESLESGVLIAKYGLINWKKKDKINLFGLPKVAAPTTRTIYDDLQAQLAQARAADGLMQAAPQAMDWNNQTAQFVYGDAQPAPATIRREPRQPIRAAVANRFSPWPATGFRWICNRGGIHHTFNTNEIATLGMNLNCWTYEPEGRVFTVTAQPVNAAAADAVVRF